MVDTLHEVSAHLWHGYTPVSSDVVEVRDDAPVILRVFPQIGLLHGPYRFTFAADCEVLDLQIGTVSLTGAPGRMHSCEFAERLPDGRRVALGIDGPVMRPGTLLQAYLRAPYVKRGGSQPLSFTCWALKRESYEAAFAKMVARVAELERHLDDCKRSGRVLPAPVADVEPENGQWSTACDES